MTPISLTALSGSFPAAPVAAFQHAPEASSHHLAHGAVARTELLGAASYCPHWNVRGDALNVLDGQLLGAPLSLSWDDDDDEDDDEAPGYTVDTSGVAVIPIHGTLMAAEPTWWMGYLGYASLPALARAIQAAAADPLASDLLLDIDSPGGHVAGLAAVCDAVWEVRQAGDKRVWAACRQVCSAAYEIASQCERVYLTQDGQGGCLGTLYLIPDWSGYYKQMGVVKYRITSDGGEAFKGEGAMGTEVTPAQQADFKRLCNEYRDLFNPVVMRGRGWTQKTVQTLADGRVHVGANAKALGFVDGIADPEDVLSALGGDGDLDGGADPAPPDDDTDDELTDLLTLHSTEDRRQGGLASILSRLGLNSGGRQKGTDMLNRPLGQGARAAQASVLAAALSLGLDSPEKVAALVGESRAWETEKATLTAQVQTLTGEKAALEGQAAAAAAQTDTLTAENAALSERLKGYTDAESRAQADALEEAKADATAAATAAFGAGSAELASAQTLIAAMTSAGVLASMTTAYKQATPKQLRPGAPRQTATAPVVTTEDPTPEQAARVQARDDALDPEKVYAKRRARR